MLARLRADLIVTQSLCDVCAVAYEDVQQVVRNDTRLKQTRIISLNPQSIWEVFDDMMRIGEAVGRREESRKVVEDLMERVGRIRAGAIGRGCGWQ